VAPAQLDTTPQDIVDELSVDYGYERSAKLVRGELFTDRYLLSVHKDDFGSDPYDTLSRALHRLNAPPDSCSQISHELTGADVIHFGYERQSEQFIYKAYLEYASRFRAYLAAGDFTESQLVHVAYKWNPMQAGESVKTYYSCQPAIAKLDLIGSIQLAYKGLEFQPPCQAVAAILEQALQRAGHQDLMLMQVYEENNPRSSYDLNLYNAEMTVSDTQSLLSQVAEYFSIPQREWSAFMHAASREQLGHISGGVGRNGQEFLTIYSGVVGRSSKNSGH
jgi:tryptophan halogenase